MLNINAQKHKVGEVLTERGLIENVIDKLIPEYNIIRFNYIRDSINFSTFQQI